MATVSYRRLCIDGLIVQNGQKDTVFLLQISFMLWTRVGEQVEQILELL